MSRRVDDPSRRRRACVFVLRRQSVIEHAQSFRSRRPSHRRRHDHSQSRTDCRRELAGHDHAIHDREQGVPGRHRRWRFRQLRIEERDRDLWPGDVLSILCKSCVNAESVARQISAASLLRQHFQEPLITHLSIRSSVRVAVVKRPGVFKPDPHEQEQRVLHHREFAGAR